MYSMQTTMTITHWGIVRDFTNGTRQCDVTLIIALPLTFKLGSRAVQYTGIFDI